MASNKMRVKPLWLGRCIDIVSYDGDRQTPRWVNVFLSFFKYTTEQEEGRVSC